VRIDKVPGRSVWDCNREPLRNLHFPGQCRRAERGRPVHRLDDDTLCAGASKSAPRQERRMAVVSVTAARFRGVGELTSSSSRGARIRWTAKKKAPVFSYR